MCTAKSKPSPDFLGWVFLRVKTRREKTPKIATSHELRGFKNPLEQLFKSAFF